ncbi:hypothetical protein [Clostridium beijerinckii]|uniref:hypothetical protein n=1 Tax=Clostridium beijerinckii TaxID=1520 RepID=UPI0017FFD3ED|nr:hypothetical protein [Clostridium beijerinckii]NRU52569.1 hypothetical protein [Clostridium beijerinckii]NYC69254.1 hypothetical protein [Clostridium beijerinckii]NYC91770.1 hypothetical protein [Clostridium beijerinckii]
MKNIFIRKLMALTIATTTVLGFGSVTAHAEWRQDNNGWWNTEGNSYSTGWKDINSKWYYFNPNGYMKTGWLSDNGKWYYLKDDGSMAVNETVNGQYKVDNNGVWIQNTTVNSNNTSTVNNSVSSTSNSNNMTNLTNNIDNSTNTNSSTSLNNTGNITNNGAINNGQINTTNNVDINVDNTSKAKEDYYKELKKQQKKSNETLKLYYENQLDSAKSDLKQAQTDLERIKTQKTVQTLKQQDDGSWQYVYEVDQEKVRYHEKQVDSYQKLVDYYEKLVKQYS